MRDFIYPNQALTKKLIFTGIFCHNLVTHFVGDALQIFALKILIL